MSPIEKVESELDFLDNEIHTMYRLWDKQDCSLVGIVEIYLFQCKKKEKEENDQYYEYENGIY